MKKLFLIFALCVLTLYSIVICYADANNNAANMTEDLPLAARLESAETLKYINDYNTILQAVIEEQRINLNKLNSICYLGTYDGNFDGDILTRSMKWNNSFFESTPLFDTDIYKGYYKLRTEKILQRYQTSEAFDYTVFKNTGRQAFDNYFKETVKAPEMQKLKLVLQSKILDKLIEMKPLDRKMLLDEVLGLGLPANNSKSMDYLYQIFESRVRIQLFDQMVKTNVKKLERLTHKVGIVISAEKSGKLLLQSKDLQNKENTVQVINVVQGNAGYRGLTTLYELFGKHNYKLTFIEDEGHTREVELEKALNFIAIDEDSIVHLDIDNLLAQAQQITEKAAPSNLPALNIQENRLKQLELLYTNKSKSAQDIVRELNRYSIYLELKESKINNLYTKGFEANLKAWKKNLDNKLNTFDIGGMADFLTYIKHFELVDRDPNKQAKERTLLAKYRNSDVQFRTPEQASLWLTDILSKIKYMK